MSVLYHDTRYIFRNLRTIDMVPRACRNPDLRSRDRHDILRSHRSCYMSPLHASC